MSQAHSYYDSNSSLAQTESALRRQLAWQASGNAAASMSDSDESDFSEAQTPQTATGTSQANEGNSQAAPTTLPLPTPGEQTIILAEKTYKKTNREPRQSSKKRSWVWDHGQEYIEVGASFNGGEKLVWICSRCPRANPQVYSTRGTDKPINHLKQKHNITKDGYTPGVSTATTRTYSQAFGTPRTPVTPRAPPTHAAKLDPNEFRNLFVNWVITARVPPESIEHASFFRLMELLSPEAAAMLRSTPNAGSQWVREELAMQQARWSTS